jgi:methylglyoxal synthase
MEYKELIWEKVEMPKQIACIAHDGKKPEMVHLIMEHKEILQKYPIVATGTTGKHIQLAGLKATSVLSGPLGGDAQIAAMIASNQITAVIFLIDPLDVHPHQVDVSMLLRICNVHNIPLATNKATADYLLKQLR